MMPQIGKDLDPAAELCGAVNTIVNDHGHLTGHITDGIGFMAALKDNDIDVIGKSIPSFFHTNLFPHNKRSIGINRCFSFHSI